jgi:hypothetical protein
MPRKLQTWAYVGLLLIGLMADGAHAEFASNAEAARPLDVGEHAPDTLVSDPGLEAAQAFHIAFHLDEQHYADQLKRGVDLEKKTTGTKNHALPVPSVFIIDASGIIRFVYSNPDFRVRLGAQELWKAAIPLAPKPQP